MFCDQSIFLCKVMQEINFVRNERGKLAETTFARGSDNDLNTIYAQLRRFSQFSPVVKHKIDFHVKLHLAD